MPPDTPGGDGDGSSSDGGGDGDESGDGSDGAEAAAAVEEGTSSFYSNATEASMLAQIVQLHTWPIEVRQFLHTIDWTPPAVMVGEKAQLYLNPSLRMIRPFQIPLLLLLVLTCCCCFRCCCCKRRKEGSSPLHTGSNGGGNGGGRGGGGGGRRPPSGILSNGRSKRAGNANGGRAVKISDSDPYAITIADDGSFGGSTDGGGLDGGFADFSADFGSGGIAGGDGGFGDFSGSGGGATGGGGMDSLDFSLDFGDLLVDDAPPSSKGEAHDAEEVVRDPPGSSRPCL